MRTPPWTCRGICASKPQYSRRCLSTAQLSRSLQSYISSSTSPHLNLSVEHHLLTSTSSDSTILFLYRNRPSIILGRNQNPWLETNLALLNDTSSNGLNERVDLIRRRSGGGTVVHDSGNINWTVICPSADFTRDKHAEMIVRALRACGVERARVNERHDVVLDQGDRASHSKSTDRNDTHATPFTSTDRPPLKVSGSAYKLTRARALHHGTCLLSSPNLGLIPKLLRSPAKGFMSARGVESVSSPVGNVELEEREFVQAVQKEFCRMFELPSIEAEGIGEELAEVPGVRDGVKELMSPEWTFLQTPQFTLSSLPIANTVSSKHISSSVTQVVHLTPNEASIDLTVRYGAITAAKILLGDAMDSPISLGDALVGKLVHEISDWRAELPRPTGDASVSQWESATEWLGRILPRVS